MGFHESYEAQRRRLQEEERQQQQAEKEAKAAAERAAQVAESARLAVLQAKENERQRYKDTLFRILSQAGGSTLINNVQKDVWHRGEAKYTYDDYDADSEAAMTESGERLVHFTMYGTPQDVQARVDHQNRAVDEYRKGHRQRASIELSTTYPVAEDVGSVFYPGGGSGDGLGGEDSVGPPDWVVGQSTTTLSIAVERNQEWGDKGHNGPEEYRIVVNDSEGGEEAFTVNPHLIDSSTVTQAVAKVSAQRAQNNGLPSQLEARGAQDIKEKVPFRKRFFW